MNKIFPVILLILTIISCGESKKEPEKSESEIRWQKQEKLDTLNQNESVNLSKKFDALTNEDSTIKFTYQIQEIAKKGNKLISFTGNISDIIQRDSNYVLKIYGIFVKHKCFVEISISTQQFNELIKQLETNSFRNKGCFIFNPKNIKSSSLLTIDSEVSTNESAETAEEANADASSELTYDFHGTCLFLKGNLVDVYMYKKLPKEDD